MRASWVDCVVGRRLIKSWEKIEYLQGRLSQAKMVIDETNTCRSLKPPGCGGPLSLLPWIPRLRSTPWCLEYGSSFSLGFLPLCVSWWTVQPGGVRRLLILLAQAKDFVPALPLTQEPQQISGPQKKPEEPCFVVPASVSAAVASYSHFQT